jgi:hypothetical protein
VPQWSTEALMPFVRYVFPGYALCLVGAVLLLAAASYWTLKSDGVRLRVKPAWWRAAVTLGFLSFVAGVGVQLAGYVWIGAVTWPR